MHPSNPTKPSPDDLTFRPLCQYMRTKAYHLDGRFDEEVLQSGESSQYWCLRNMQPFGPDGDYVCPEDCTASRSCFKEG